MELINWLEDHLLACPYKKYLGLDCLGCGMQRSFIALLKGEIVQSIYLYPALIPMIFLLLFLILHLVFKYENGGLWLKYLFLFVASIVLLNFLIKTELCIRAL